MHDMDHGEENINGKNKVIQEVKRRQLHMKLEQYELQLLDYEQHFHREFSDLEMNLSKEHSSDTKGEFDRIMQCLQALFDHQKNRTVRTIRYRESYLRAALKKLQRRQASRNRKKKNVMMMVDVYPQVIVDVKKLCLNRNQLDYLSHHGA